jgi:ribosomal peptide maturation radical SAM protein 1
MKVLLVNMPFGAVRPAIGVSLLKAHLERIGVDAKVVYLNLWFSQRLGTEDYHYIADIAPSQSLAGDWVFARSAFGPRNEADALYFEEFPKRFAKFCASAQALEILRRARRLGEPFLEDCLREVDWHACQIIGFTSTFTQHVASLALARRLKERFPGTSIVFGGANCESEMGLQLHRSFGFVDFVCSGESDISFPKLVQALRDNGEPASIPGVIARVHGESRYASLTPERVRDLDTLPYPQYDDYFEQLAKVYPTNKSQPHVVMETSRGCWWGEKRHCTFCGLNGTSLTFRSKSAKRVLDEITTLQSRHQVQLVQMVDNIFDMRYFRDLLPELQRRQLKLDLFYETKANLTKEQIRALRAAGIVSIQPGIESFSTEILRIMRKGTTAAQNVQLLKWCKELGVKPLWNLMYGFPGEDPADYGVMAELMDAIRHLQPPVGFGAIRLDRFSPNFDRAEAFGIVNVRPDRNYGFIYGLSESELFNLAYYFEHDYADARNPEIYVNETFEAFRQWQGEPDSRGLIYVDHGDTLAIWDLRSRPKRTVTILRGAEREVYLYCDQARGLSQIEALAAFSYMGIREFLEGLIRDELMIRLDARYLSLAVQAPRRDAENSTEEMSTAQEQLLVL